MVSIPGFYKSKFDRVLAATRVDINGDIGSTAMEHEFLSPRPYSTVKVSTENSVSVSQILARKEACNKELLIVLLDLRDSML